MNLAAIVNLVVFALALAWLGYRRQKGMPLSTSVLIAVLLGALLGAAAQAVYGLGSPAITGATPWVGVVAGTYVRLLQMVIAPLVLVSILAAVTKLNDTRSLGEDQRRRARPAAGHHRRVGDDRHRRDPHVRPARRRPGAGRPRAGARHVHGGPAR